MKLSPLTIFLIFLSVGLAALSFGFFQKWMPNKQESGFYQEYVNQLQTEADKMPQARRRRKTAEEMVNLEAQKWQTVVAAHTPTASLATGGIDVSVPGWQLAVDARRFRNSVQLALNKQLKRGGVKVITGPEIPEPSDSALNIVSSYFNYPAIPFPVVIYDLGAVTVEGTYEQIMANVRSWSNMPNYLAVADGLRLDGTSPILTGTYSVSMVGFIRGKEIFPMLPEMASGQAGAGGVPGGGNTPPAPATQLPPSQTRRKAG